MEEIEQLMNAHRNDPKQVDLKDELLYTFQTVIQYVFYALLSIIFLGIAISLFIGTINLSEVWNTLADVSGYLFLIFGLFATLSYYAGSATYMGEMTRRAWTNSRRNTDEDMRKDFTSFIDTPKVIYSLFLASLIIILVDYFFIS